MENLTIGIISVALLAICIGVYVIGKRKNIDLLKCVGRKGSIITLILIFVEILILFKRGFDLN